ncbi:MAG: HEAT repeat domain-containing protein, partial [Nitrososphaerales archaeon]
WDQIKISRNENYYLDRDMIGHYELGLLVRCLDESPDLVVTAALRIEVTKRIQERLLDFYRLYISDVLSGDFDCSFLQLLRISPKVLGGKNDLLAKIPWDKAWGNYKFYSFASKVLKFATPRLLEILAIALTEKFVDDNAIDMIIQLGPLAATDDILAGLARLLSNQHVLWPVYNAIAMTVSSAASTKARTNILNTLAKRLSNEVANVRRDAARTIQMIGPSAAIPSILDALTVNLSDETHMVKYCSAEAIGVLAKSNDKILEGLKKQLSDDDDAIRKNAADAMSKLLNTKPSISESLAQQPLDQEDEVRSKPAYAIRKLEPSTDITNVLERLQHWLNDEWSSVYHRTFVEAYDRFFKSMKIGFAETTGKIGPLPTTSIVLGALEKWLAKEKWERYHSHYHLWRNYEEEMKNELSAINRIIEKIIELFSSSVSSFEILNKLVHLIHLAGGGSGKTDRLKRFVKNGFGAYLQLCVNECKKQFTRQTLKSLVTLIQGAYIAGNIALQVSWEKTGYILKGYIDSQPFFIALTSDQAKCLSHLIPLIIEKMKKNCMLGLEIVYKLEDKLLSDCLLKIKHISNETWASNPVIFGETMHRIFSTPEETQALSIPNTPYADLWIDNEMTAIDESLYDLSWK